MDLKKRAFIISAKVPVPELKPFIDATLAILLFADDEEFKMFANSDGIDPVSVEFAMTNVTDRFSENMAEIAKTHLDAFMDG